MLCEEAVNLVEVKKSRRLSIFHIKVNGALVHSKKESGDGFQSARKAAAVFEAVESATES